MNFIFVLYSGFVISILLFLVAVFLLVRASRANKVKNISNQLAKSLEKLKVEPFGAQGEEFNPEIHNAISKIDDENFEKNCISQVFQTGYKIGDKIIRHAMVQVANCD